MALSAHASELRHFPQVARMKPKEILAEIKSRGKAAEGSRSGQLFQQLVSLGPP